MSFTLTPEDQQKLRRIADEPLFWLRDNYPEVKEYEDELSDLIDTVKSVWDECRRFRIFLAFIIDLELQPNPTIITTIKNYKQLQSQQQAKKSSLVFVIDLHGNVLGMIDMGDEIDPTSMKIFSQMQKAIIFWLGPTLEIYCKGYTWEPRDKRKVLRSIKSKQRTSLLSMNDYQEVLDTHFEQCIKGEAVAVFWVHGKKNEVLLPKPEKIFQKSLCNFLNREVDCVQADMEPMFKDGSRCDIRVFLDNYDLYFIEVKWIGYCAKQPRGDKHEYTADHPTELDAKYARGGAIQTMTYIENNNSIGFDHRIKLGIYLVYDAYPEPVTPLNYGKEIEEYPLLTTIEYQLVNTPPSKKGKELAKQQGFI